MHRFRKRSDAKRGQVPTTHTLASGSQGILPELPPTDDFRTSLILPDLSRRFSLLRSATGESVPVEQLKTRLANHRKQGSENQISEEEEDMLLETLNRLRSRVASGTSAEGSQEQFGPTQDGAEESTLASSITSSPSRSAKRYSNQLFGSGRLRDYSHTKSSPSKTSRTSALTPSVTSADSQVHESQGSSVTPYTDGVSVQSSSIADAALPTRSDSLSPYDDEEDDNVQSLSAAEYRLNMAMGPNVFKRASLAIQQAMKEIEDEVEDEILLPRSTPIPRGSIDQHVHSPEVRNSEASFYESAMAISSDKALPDEFRERRASPIPARTVPGYVPGMPRPMTPRDFDFDEQRSHSTTPRAKSPYDDLPTSSAASISSKLRRESLSSSKPSITSSVSAAPYFLQRSANAGSFGRSTPDDSHRSTNGDSVDFGDSFSSSILSRRRPVSPLSSPPYQPIAASGIRPPSRPTTPSNVIWTPNPNQTHRANGSGHSRNNSWTGEGGLSSLEYSNVFPSNPKFGPRPLRSPRTDRFDFSPGSSQSSSTSSPPNSGRAAAVNPYAYIQDASAGSPPAASKYTSRSDTPTQNAQHGQASPGFGSFDSPPRNGSKRASRQNGPSSPFNLNGFSSLGFAPRPSSSRSSLDSVGSSFHSWDESDKVLSLFSDSKDQQATAWHDFGDTASHSTPGTSPHDDDDEDSERILQQHGGLRPADVTIIQNKLVFAALTKIANTDPRDRAPSAMRRARRPSTSQSNYARVASPPPQSAVSATFTTDDHISKASALLNSVVDSIKDQPKNVAVTPAPPANLADDTQSSPNSKRNLTYVLFGAEDEVNVDEDTVKFTPQTSIPAPPPPIPSKGAVAISTPAESVPPTPTTPKTQEVASSPAYVTPYLLRNPSTSRVPKNTAEEADLAREVKQKTDAAMVALNKDPSHANLGDSLKHSPSIRRRVDPSQISTPKLVSTTTSVETVPIRTPSLSSNNAGSSKLGSRFKKLRGSLRVKNTAASSEDAAVDATKSSSTSQIAIHDSAYPTSAGTPRSATESGRFKVPVAPSPPASAGPGLKGFMARFRNKRTTEMSANSELSTGTSASQQARAISPLSPRFKDPITPTTPTTPKQQTASTERAPVPSSPRAPGQPRPMYSRFPPANMSAPPDPPTEVTTPEPSQSETALEQLFKAANNLGLDQKALTELLARSGATAAQPGTPRQEATIDPVLGSPSRKVPGQIQQVAYVGSTSSDQTTTPTNQTSLANQQRKKGITGDLRPTTPDDSVTRKGSVRKVDHLRKPKENPGDPVANAVVRRTLIYANDMGSSGELSALMQRKNSARRRRVSANSVSVRSIQERVPTPPPPKATKRFSADGMPPMPRMPNIGSAAGQMLNVPSTSMGGAIEKSNSTYDSLYDMYAGESRVASVVAVDPNAHADQQTRGDLFESGPALELVELANGETIWNIVNGLRDGDDESIYSGRASFTSEYSTREPGSDFVKDHSRAGSKGSATSFISKKKAQTSQLSPQQGKLRPETKVFHSTSAQIGRLIESLSQGADAGSFNFLPSGPAHGPGHSASSSLSTNDINWTVEERLERMLGSMNTS